MTDLQTFQDLVVKGLGNRSDTDTAVVVKAAINFAISLAALVFNPKELQKQTTLIVTGGDSYTAVAPLTRLLNIQTVQNTTDSNRMWYIPREDWNVILPSSIGTTKYYTLFGSSLYVKDTPTSNKYLVVDYCEYPAPLVNAGDTVEFELYDSYITSTAMAICWAFYEEGGSAGIMQKINELATIPLALSAEGRYFIEKQKTGLQAVFSQLGGSK